MRTQRVSIDQAKEQLSDLIATAAAGGEVIIAENGKALARLIPATDSAAYTSHPPTAPELASDEESLAWDEWISLEIESNSAASKSSWT